MKTTVLCACLAGWAVSAAAAEPQPIRYQVAFRGDVVATQAVSIVRSAGLTTVSTFFEAELPVFVALHRYSERLSATFREDGTVERLGVEFDDGPVRIVLAGTPWGADGLQVVRTGRDGTATNLIERADYDFHSLVMYGTAPARFLPTNSPARVLSIAEGRVIPVRIQTITESETFERQYLASTHLVWTEGNRTSHSWHPERFSDLPRRYIRQTEAGEFTFTLLR